MKIQVTVATVISCLALEASAFWRLPCRGRVTLQRIDPIVNPGKAAGHVHAVQGPDTLGANSTVADLMAGSCSSCQVKQDKSAYWTPAMYFQHADTGKLEIVPQTGGMLVYYLQRGDNVKAAPAGLRMLAGDPFLRSFPYRTLEKSLWQDQDRTEDALRQKAVGFNCLNYDEPANAALGLRAMPDDPSKCRDGLRAEVFFPSCWDGKRLDAPDHKDHMRYPSLMDDGTCPDTHPVRIVSLFFETIWNVAYFAGKEGSYVFSDGDPHGYGYHGDFMNGWDQEVLEQAVAECRSTSGVVEECGVFEHRTLEEMLSCKVQHIDIVEDVVGPMDKLPGCNPITYGPERASKDSCDNTPVVTKPKEDDQPGHYDGPDDSNSDHKLEFLSSTIPTVSIPTPTINKPQFIATSPPGTPEAPSTHPPAHPHLVVITVTSTVTVDVYPTRIVTVDVYPTPEVTPNPYGSVPKRRRHMHGGAHHHHKH